MIRKFAKLLITGCLLLSGCDNSSGDNNMSETKLIPRKVLFGNPDKASVRTSPDGKHISFLAPHNGVLNVWVAKPDDIKNAKPITDDKKRGIFSYGWTYNNDYIVYAQDNDGDENHSLYSVNINTLEHKELTPFKKAKSHTLEASPRFPDELLIVTNKRKPEYFDIYRLNIITGMLDLVFENNEYAGYLTDDDFKLRFAYKQDQEGQTLLYKHTDGKFELFDTVGYEDSNTTYSLGFDKSKQVLYRVDSRGRDTSALLALDLKTGNKKVIGHDAKADISDYLVHPTEKNIQGYASTYDRKKWTIIDDSVKGDLEYLESLQDGELEIISRSLDDKIWIVVFFSDIEPVSYYRYDRQAKTADFLFVNQESMKGQPWVHMHPVIIKSRDGLDLVSYLSLPASSVKDPKDLKPVKPVPLILKVHGGPTARDGWGMNTSHQWLANRGYAVLSVNYRGSTGIGKKFIRAGDGEWAARMHDDLIDAVNWAVEEGIADKDKVAIYGGSYGGYAALVGLTFTPNTFTCAVDVVGPSNLETLLQSIPPYWKPHKYSLIKKLGGDPDTKEGKEFLKSRSPLTFVDKIEKPLLIAQGANDPRVKQAESDQIVEAMNKKNIPVTYVLYPDEGHGFARPENSMSFSAVTEGFLTECLGGRFEPIGDDFKGSSITIPHGKEYLPEEVK